MSSAFNTVSNTVRDNTILDNDTDFLDVHCFGSADEHLGYIMQLCGIVVTEAQSFNAGWTAYMNQDVVSFVANILVELPTSKSDIPKACDTIARKIREPVADNTVPSTGAPVPIAEDGGSRSGSERKTVASPSPNSAVSRSLPDSSIPIPPATNQVTIKTEEASYPVSLPLDTVTVCGPDGTQVLPAPPTSSPSSPRYTPRQGCTSMPSLASDSDAETNEVTASIVLEQEEDEQLCAEMEQRTREGLVSGQTAHPSLEPLPLASTSSLIAPPALQPTHSTTTLPPSSHPPLSNATLLSQQPQRSWISNLAATVRLSSSTSISATNIPSQLPTSIPGIFSPPLFPPLPPLPAVPTPPSSPPSLQYPDEVSPHTSRDLPSVTQAQRGNESSSGLWAIKQEEDWEDSDSEDDWLPTWGPRDGGEANNSTQERSISQAGPGPSMTVRRRSQRVAAAAAKAKVTKPAAEGQEDVEASKDTKGKGKAKTKAKTKTKVGRGKKTANGVKGKKGKEESTAKHEETTTRSVRRPIGAFKSRSLDEAVVAPTSAPAGAQPPALARRSKRTRALYEEDENEEKDVRPTRRARTARK